MVPFVYILLCLLWGSTWLAIKIGLQEAPPLTTAALRFLLAMSVLSAIGAIRGFKYPRDPQTLLKLAYPGFYMYGASYALLYFAEVYINSALTAVLFGSFPFFVALISWFKYRAEKLDSLAWLGVAIGFVGVVLISYDSLQTSPDLFLGSMLALGGSFTAAYGMVIHKQLHVHTNIVVAANVQMIFGGIFLVAGALIFENVLALNVTPTVIGTIVYLALFGTVVTFLGYYWLLRKTRAIVLSLTAFVTPVVAILIGVVFADESLSFLIAVGTALILSSIMLVIRRPSVKPEPQRAG